MKKILHNFGILFALLAVSWIILGSTIKFHMEYVYHNHIDLVQSQILKLKEKDSKKHFKFLDKSQQIKCFPDLIGDYCNNISGVAVLNLSEKSIYARYLFDLLTSEYISLHSLRGPPIT